jgi:hypothetical protein
MAKMAEAMRGMAQSGVQEEDLNVEWQKQVQAQTKPEGTPHAVVWCARANAMI